MKRTNRSSKSVVLVLSGSAEAKTCLEKTSEFPVEFARRMKNAENMIVARIRGRPYISFSCSSQQSFCIVS
jgi:hypothetical protein